MARRSPEDWHRLLEAHGWRDYAGLAKRLGCPFGTVAAGAKRAKEWFAKTGGIAKTENQRTQKPARARRVEQIRSDLTDTQAAAFWRILDGQSDARIGRDLGIDRGTVAAWKRDPVFAAHLSEVRADRDTAAQESAVAGKVEAIEADREVLRGLLVNFRVAGDPELRAKLAGPIRSIAADVMDRGGMPKTERVEHSGEVRTSAYDALPTERLTSDLDDLEGQLTVLEGGRS